LYDKESGMPGNSERFVNFSKVRRFLLALGVCAAAIGVWAPRASAQDGCAPLLKAWHVSGNFKSKNLDHSGIDAQQALVSVVSTGQYSMKCKLLRDEAVNGEAATVYLRTYRSNTGNVDELMWVSKKSGKILRSDLDADMGGKGKGHVSMLVIPG
jgi:hypothetical protein